MHKAKLRLVLIPPSEGDVEKAYIAARQCRSHLGAGDLIDTCHKADAAAQGRLIHAVLKQGHRSIGEHINFFFAFDGFSRLTGLQGVRHRHTSPTQQSQRAVNLSDFGFIIPPSYGRLSPDQLAEVLQVLDDVQALYNRLTEWGIPEEDARYPLPEGTETAITLTINLSELMHVCNERLCGKAQWEIRGIVAKMRAEVVKVLPWTADLLVPKCLAFGGCREKEPCGLFRGTKEPGADGKFFIEATSAISGPITKEK